MPHTSTPNLRCSGRLSAPLTMTLGSKTERDWRVDLESAF